MNTIHNRSTIKERRKEQLPAHLASKRRRLIARLKSFGKTGEMSESIQVLRKRLHPFVKLPKRAFVREEFQQVLIQAIGGEEAYRSAKYVLNRERKHANSKARRKTAKYQSQ